MSRIAKAAAVIVGTGAVALSGAGMALADAGAEAAAVGSPGVLSGNVVQVPINIPINLCGNTIDIIGILNPAFGNTCANVSEKSEKVVEKDKKDHEDSKNHEDAKNGKGGKGSEGGYGS
ncbi:chaplin [Streptomyces sp. SP18CS02]|uniref:chaplin n=1 Tax=Streptomyces sp. SP18CS02 TaxID=3002531 RepID=UPI002E7A0884|nr:chaplin [Streptomyces sp. SP18CS02]MEE1751117.1 chaplin [Streptomyces sp. SP18CS02]